MRPLLLLCIVTLACASEPPPATPPANTPIAADTRAELATASTVPTADAPQATATEPLPPWLPPAAACPADVAPPRLESDVAYLDERCRTDIDSCYAGCAAGTANDCYAAGVHLQKTGGAVATVEALFLRACKLGLATGCTNRAAGWLNVSGHDPTDSCPARSFALTCAAGDSWGCTMRGVCLLRGIGVTADEPAARRAFHAACFYGQQDPACQEAERLTAELDAAAP